MRRVEASVVINRPLEEVFAFVHNPVDHPQWEAAQFDVEQTSEGPMGVGTTFRGGIRLLGLPIGWTAECTGYDLNRQLEFRVNAGPLQLQEILILEHIEAGTSFTIFYEGDLRGLVRLAGPIVVRVFQRQVGSDLANLKAILEAQPRSRGEGWGGGDRKVRWACARHPPPAPPLCTDRGDG